jgi:dihydroorotase-like cyclic amidohydrolase
MYRSLCFLKKGKRRIEGPLEHTSWDPNLETFLPLILSEGVNKGRVSIERFVQLTSENPARIFGLYPRKGAIRIGSDADPTIVDLKKEHTLSSDQLRCVGDYTPFEGRTVKGMRVLTIVRGKVVAEKGEVVANPGYGRFVRIANQ